MDFVIENYVWFIIAGVILVMALIGYIAEKTDFVKEKEPRKKKENKNKTEKIDVQPLAPTEPVIPQAEMLSKEATTAMDWDMPNMENGMDGIPETNTFIDPIGEEVVDLSDVTVNKEPELKEAKFQIESMQDSSASEEQSTSITPEENANQDDIWKF